MLAVQNMLDSKNFLFPSVDGSTLWGKPPLKTLITAASVYLFGQDILFYRLPDGLFALGTTLLLLTYPGQSQKFRVVASLSFLSSPIIFGEHVALASVQDSALVFFVSAAIIHPKFAVPSLICATLTKGVAAGPFVLAAIFFIPGNKVRNLTYILLPIFLYYIYHFDSLDHVLGHEVFRRASVGFHNQGKPLYYIRVFFDPSYHLSNSLHLLGLVSVVISFRRKLLCWILIPLVVFTIPDSKLEWYLAPIIPALALSFAHFCNKIPLAITLLPLAYLVSINATEINNKPGASEFRKVSSDLMYSQPPLQVYLDETIMLTKTEKALLGRTSKHRFDSLPNSSAGLLSFETLNQNKLPLKQVKVIPGIPSRAPFVVATWKDTNILHSLRPTTNRRDANTLDSPFSSGWSVPLNGRKYIYRNMDAKRALLRFQLDHISTLSPVSLKVWLSGQSRLSTTFNGEPLGDIIVDTKEWQLVTLAIPSSSILKGDNFLSLELISGSSPKFLRTEWREAHG